MRQRRSAAGAALAVGLAICAALPAAANGVTVSDLLQPAPRQPVGAYDQFGELLTPLAAFGRVWQEGLNPFLPASYQRLGMVRIGALQILRGEVIFFNEEIGDQLGVQRLFGVRLALYDLLPELLTAIVALRGRPTTNLALVLNRDWTIGTHEFPRGTVIKSGLDVEAGAWLPIGVRLDGNITCALCHVTLDARTGRRLDGVPNSDLDVAFMLAFAKNSAAAFARLDIDPFDAAFLGNGKTIIDSAGQPVELPDPEAFETAFDDLILDVPPGQFESSPDRINNTTQIPSLFTFRSGPYGFDGVFGVGPFAGLAALTNAVHTSEINLLAAAQTSAALLGIDPEAYLGIALQNAVDPGLRLPGGAPVRPSEWLRQVAPDLALAELEDQVEAPGAGQYPALQPSLFALSGLIFSPRTASLDLATGRFMGAVNAMSAYQNSLVPPPNRSLANLIALVDGSVARGAQAFLDAGCAGCHAPPFYTDNAIHPLAAIGSNPARALSRLGVEPLLVAPMLYSFDTPVPIPADAELLEVPTAGFSATPTSLPDGLAPGGGYRTTSLRGIAFSAPYLHDGGVAVRAGALSYPGDGSFAIADPTGLGVPGTLAQGINADAAASLRALLDRGLRAAVIAANQASPGLVRSNLDGTGHAFWADAAAGFTPAEQADLIAFLLALDDDPGRF